jgi:hypothetical protein
MIEARVTRVALAFFDIYPGFTLKQSEFCVIKLKKTFCMPLVSVLFAIFARKRGCVPTDFVCVSYFSSSEPYSHIGFEQIFRSSLTAR